MDKKTFLLRRSFALFLTIVLSSTMFLALYHFDNKYTKNAPQAINGALYVLETDWTNTPIRYLMDGWRYYADRLLTPETLQQQGDNYQYLSIGNNSNFSMGERRRSPHGSASYALTLYLPEEVHTYTIELPEIYSAYRFYIDDKLKLQIGEPDIIEYHDQTQCRMITFEASGKITLLLAVSNHSWIYSGLVYPPAFGEPLNLNTTRGIRIGLCLILVTVTLMLAIFSFYLAIRNRRMNNIWFFFLLCMATAVFKSYSVVHGILTLSIQPWYSIEFVSGYLVTLLVIILHNRICDTKIYAQIISSTLAGVVCILALLYGLFAAHLTMSMMLAFSNLVFCFKLLTAVYLLFTAAIAAHRNIEKASILLYADIVYACAFVWDRLLPNYEPVFSGWFQEWGSLILVFATGMVLWYDIAMGYRHSLVYAEEQRQMKRQLTMQVEHLRQTNQKVEESTKLRHDFRHHLRTLMTLSEEGRRDELENYIRSITAINDGTRIGRLTDNIELDAVVQYYSNLAQSSGIQFRARLQIPAKLHFPIVDLCGLLGNLLENAVEACQRQENKDNAIFIAGRTQNGQLEFVVDNSFDGKIKTIGKKYLSSKRNGFGLGISSVLETVDRYGGVINLYTDENGFHAEVSLPLGIEERIPLPV
ncbi:MULTISPECIES: sensor histidine kinase [unclassified Sedimentibacter]|uniref:sensor histidine kinase n=1 Tax=unclassified Sedimentibacter TaxID=2649220 RepID=UPI0027DF0845|nr:GHKL domain-containing protein [Sedimentibacter sp. MB35-C1]WMJ76896.1 GHKL domain-containing protein [Sedimentibacter sp. MB35-C1]